MAETQKPSSILVHLSGNNTLLILFKQPEGFDKKKYFVRKFLHFFILSEQKEVFKSYMFIRESFNKTIQEKNNTMKVVALLCFLSVLTPIYGQISLDSIIHRLDDIQGFRSRVSYSITQPLTDGVVDYTLDMAYRKMASDTLGGASYYIEITDGHPAVKGDFYCYCKGDYFNFANQRLREYHASENVAPFLSRQSDDYIIPGVHLSGLFVGELPGEMKKELCRFRDNPNAHISVTTDSAYGEASNITVFVEEQRRDLPLREITYKFDAKSLLPTYKEVVNSPGHMASQTVTTRYEETLTGLDFPDDYFSEKRLLRDKPEIMASFRKGNFRAEQLRGRPAPDFSLPTLSEGVQRFTLTPSQEMKVLLFVDTKASFCPPAIERLDSLCRETNTELKVLFKENSRSDVEKYWEESGLKCEAPLYNASNVFIQYGVTGFPSAFLLTPDNDIADIYIGYSPDLPRQVAEGITAFYENDPQSNH